MSVLQPEAGIFYGLCWIIVILRFASRRLHLGSWKHLQLDDYLILAAMVTDTVLIAVMHEVVQTSSNLIEPGEDITKFTDAEIESRVYGSKLVLVVEQMQILTIWLIKACLLIMYGRMTTVLPQRKIVVATAVYVGVTFVLMEILYLGVWCRPFSQYFAVPPNNKQCSAATNHLITNAVFNISSDLIILSIPLPLLFKVRLPLKNKAILMGVFLIGAFTIVAAALNKYYSFTNPFGTEWTIWYLRESYTALLCANLPLIYPLIQRVFKLRNWSSGAYNNDQYRLGSDAQQVPQPSRNTWNSPLPKRTHPGSRDMVRRTEGQDNTGYSVAVQGGRGSRFLTSAIVMNDMRKPMSPGLESPASFKTDDSGKTTSDPYQKA
ncbi:hypothetical protein DE146DRAFT_761542 [Phaeosphaeria sp. MPI-PUGE-AT-0046c]|nr:hypothetical protein DE146DRAFT_761542 [Phaeosphaeria sp. MPI-PUGE-AT-0046c]